MQWRSSPTAGPVQRRRSSPRGAIRPGPGCDGGGMGVDMSAETHTPKADPSRGHERGVYRWPGISVKRTGFSRYGAQRSGLQPSWRLREAEYLSSRCQREDCQWPDGNRDKVSVSWRPRPSRTGHRASRRPSRLAPARRDGRPGQGIAPRAGQARRTTVGTVSSGFPDGRAWSRHETDKRCWICEASPHVHRRFRNWEFRGGRAGLAAGRNCEFRGGRAGPGWPELGVPLRARTGRAGPSLLDRRPHKQ
jgi:hypothetical protein